MRPDGTAVAPEDAPEVVKRVILAGNAIAKFPYKWGGGHGAWRDNGYDCSGSVSFALAAAGLLNRPLTSGLFMRYGDRGPGDWITIYANDGHVFMVVAGLRFDTSGQGRAGTRWQEAPRSVERLRGAPHRGPLGRVRGRLAPAPARHRSLRRRLRVRLRVASASRVPHSM